MEFFLAFSLLGGSPAPASPGDHWFGPDKFLHFTVSALLQSVTHSALRSRGLSYSQASRAAAGVTLTVGVGKELWDLHRRDDFSLRDLTWDAIGTGTGAVIVRQLDR